MPETDTVLSTLDYVLYKIQHFIWRWYDLNKKLQLIDSNVTLDTGTADLCRKKRHSPSGNYTACREFEDDKDGTDMSHLRSHQSKSFTPVEYLESCWNEELQLIDSVVTLITGTADLCRKKRHSPSGNYTACRTFKDDKDGTDMSHLRSHQSKPFTPEIAALQWSTSVDEKRSSRLPRVDLDGTRTKLSTIRGCRPRRLWKVLLVCHLMMCSSAAFQPDIHVKPYVRYLTVWEGESHEIDCYVTYTERTDDLHWTKRYPNKGSYTGERRTDDNGDGWFTSHSLLRFKSIKSSDAGIYTCTFNPRPGFGSQYEIKLIVQEKCDAGKYGIGCSSSCSEFCNKINTSGEESPCNYKDGHCLHGCLPGYMGANCSSVCEAGKYGLGCSSSCSEFCKKMNTPGKELPCSYTDGHCLHGCLPGYWGASCFSVCELGKYGPDCSLTCSDFCTGYGSLDKSWCHPETGICVDGCQDGFIGMFCTTGDYTGVLKGLIVGFTILACVTVGVVIYFIWRIRNRLKNLAVRLKPVSLSSKDKMESSDMNHRGDVFIALSKQQDAGDEAAETGEETPLMSQLTTSAIPKRSRAGTC